MWHVLIFVFVLKGALWHLGEEIQNDSYIHNIIKVMIQIHVFFSTSE